VLFLKSRHAPSSHPHPKARLGLIVYCLCLMITSGLSTAASANDYEPQLKALIDAKVTPWLTDQLLISQIIEQNAKTANLSTEEIDRLDKQWRDEAKAEGGPLINEILANKLSAFLKEKKAGAGDVFSEIFVMDAKGLNVGQSDITSDYFQGDEAKWQKSFGQGAGAVFIDELEYDESSKTFNAQVNLAITDPASGKAIGAITLGVNIENLPN
jgi:hypothetical protein